VGKLSEGASMQGWGVGLLNIMYKKLIFIQFLLILFSGAISGQVKIRIFANHPASSGVFTVTAGKYELDIYDGESMPLTIDEPVILAMFNGKIAVKTNSFQSFMCDSLIVRGLTGNDRFSFRVNGSVKNRQFYSGDLKCRPDLGILLFINICDVEQYIAGVVRTEGGTGRNIEYLKSQAILARTFMYKHLSRHLLDGYNFCDNTHCQAFNGVSTDTLIERAALETKGLVILDRDSSLVISAFHSNCGGETSISEDVWLSGNSYIKKVIDPYCTKSPNATWRKSIPVSDWEAYLKKSGYKADTSAAPSYNFSQLTRQNNYTIGSFSLPFRQIRNDLNLRSAFFSVIREGDLITFKGRGYGHGVGLCQEGAIVMASRGFKCSEIIRFYYSDVIISDVKNAKIVKNDL
jgi:stage II sporulation protein D